VLCRRALKSYIYKKRIQILLSSSGREPVRDARDVFGEKRSLWGECADRSTSRTARKDLLATRTQRTSPNKIVRKRSPRLALDALPRPKTKSPLCNRIRLLWKSEMQGVQKASLYYVVKGPENAFFLVETLLLSGT